MTNPKLPEIVTRAIAGLGVLLCLALTSLSLGQGRSQSSLAISFGRDIRPILAANCYQCHGPDGAARKGGLRLDTESGAFAALASGKAFVAGHPEASRAFLRMTEKDAARRMPPPSSNKSLTPAQIDLIRSWIVQGAHWETHWSFVPPTSPPVPIIQNPTSRIRNPIDAFVLARLGKVGLKPSPQASKETLLRRVTLDLTGLPPTLQETDSFVNDASPNAYEKIVDRLLASPRFGERWVWEWLEAGRYSDTNGYQEDRSRAMWPWRDWCIRALNDNMPFDQFTVQQIAGDMLPNPTLDQRIATGFNRNHMLNGEGGRIPEESRIEYVIDRVDTTSTVWLGLTLGCSRCHDHKYDPFTNREYYQLFAYFNNVPESGAVDADGAANPVLRLPTEQQTKRIAELEKTIADLNGRLKPLDAKAPERADLQKQLDATKGTRDQVSREIVAAMVMEEQKQPRETHMMIRGAYDKLGDRVTCATPAALNPLPESAQNNRLGFALWLVDRSNPLTARVEVNRIWQQLFGTGLVKTAEDFGTQGERPSHPELLDWLAVRFRDGVNPAQRPNDPPTQRPVKPWDVKALIRLIVTSATYKQSSNATKEMLDKDPDNRLLARAPRFRLPSFVLRDQALAIGGLLVEKVGGPPVKPYQPEGVWEDFSYGKITYAQDHGEGIYRRSLYTFWRRSVAPTIFFDTSPRRVCTVRVARTNTPLQSLTLLNDTTFVEASRKLAERMIKEGGATPDSRIAWAFRLAAGRRIQAAEVSVLTRSFQRLNAHYAADQPAALKMVSTGESPRDASLNPAELATYSGVAALILNLDEVISRE